MAEAVNAQITDAVTQSNVKVVGDIPAIAMGNLMQMMAQTAAIAAQNQVAHQQQMNAIAQAATTVAVNKLLHTQPVDALAQTELMSGSDTAAQMMNLLAALNTGQQGAKVAQSTPPETAQG